MRSCLFLTSSFLLILSVFSAQKDYTKLKDLPIEKTNPKTLGAIYDLTQDNVDLDLFIGSPDECQEVVFCAIKAIPENAKKMEDRDCSDPNMKIVFRPLENTMKVGTKQYFYQRPVARFTPDGQGGHVIEVLKDFDGYLTDQEKEKVTVKLGKSLIVLSSGPSCPTRLRVMNDGFKGQRVIMSHITGDKPRLPVFDHMTRRSVLPDTIFETSKMKSHEGCCFPGAYDFDSVIGDDYNGWQTGESLKKVTWQRYTVSEKNRNDNGLRSLVLFVQDGCRWLRICWDLKETSKNLCQEVWLDMYFEGGAYVPIDNMQATPFIVQEGTTDLNKFVLEMKKYSERHHTLTLKYGDAYEPEDYYAVEHHMHSTRVTSQNDSYVTLVAAPNCKAGLTRHTGNVGLGGSDVARSIAGRQKLHINKCDCFSKK